MDTHLRRLRHSFNQKALGFYFGPDDPHYKALKEFQDDQLRQLHDMDARHSNDKTKPSDTYLHSYRVANDMFLFANYIGLNHQIASNLRWATVLHDIGKLDIPPEILNKPGRLNDEEYAVMKKHARLGAERIKKTGIDHPMVKLAAEIAMYHHEREDGGGYYGLKGKDISSRLRLVHLCDIYDAVSAPRSYRSAKEQLTPYETMKAMLDPHGFLHKAVDMMLTRPFCLLKLNLMEGDLSRDEHKMLENYLLHPEVYTEDDYALPLDLRDID
jgi:putative nucleotidyltransferase with HDIG domain